MVAEGVSLKNWQDFLHSNKTELFNFLTKAPFVTFCQKGKKFVFTEKSTPLLCDPHSLFLCTCEETDIRHLLHETCAAHCSHFKVLVRTVNTDVIVVSVCCSTSGSRLRTLGSIWNRKTFPLLGCPNTGYCTGDRKGPGTFHVSCPHWL